VAQGPLGLDAAERRFILLFLPVALGFGARMSLVAFNGPLVRLFTDNGYLIGLVLAAGPLVATVGNPTFGWLSDRTWTRRGRRIPYALVGVPLSTAMLFLIPVAPSYAILLVLFLLRALFISIGGVPLMSLIPDKVRAGGRGRAMALFMVVGGAGAIAIQATGKLFWERDPALIYQTAGAIALLFAVPPLLFIREPRPDPAELAAARARPLPDPLRILRELHRREPVAVYLASAALRFLGIGTVVGYVTLFAANDLGVSVGDAALAVATGGLLRLLLAVPCGRLVDTRDRKRLLLGAVMAHALVQLLTGLLVGDLWHLYVAIAVATMAQVLEATTSGPFLMDLLPADRRGELLGVNMLLGNVFQALGALLGGALFAWTGGYRAVYPTAALCLGLSALILTQVRATAAVDPAAASAVPTAER
jgi:MFS family permease